MAVLSRLILAAGLACGALGDQVALNRPTSDVQESYDAEAKPWVTSELLQKAINIEDMMSRVEDLYDLAKLSERDYDHPTRVIGSKGHAGTVDYILQTLKNTGHGYHISVQHFPVTVGKVLESTLTVDGLVLKNAAPMGFSPATKDKRPVSGDLIHVANQGCDTKDFPKEVKGNIALISRGNCPFGDKSRNAGKAGAVAAVIYNTDDGELGGTLGEPQPEKVATFGITGKLGKGYAERLKNGVILPATAYVNSEFKTTNTTNVIAQTKEGDQDNVVMIGAHSDSVEEGPGCNDDGSGLITVLELAVRLAKFDVKNAVRFAWWAAEEEGLLGSTYYADHLSAEENKKIRMFMDIDMMASPNFAYQIYDSVDGENPAGSQALRDIYIKWFSDHKLNYTLIPFDGRSDYVGFLDHGIPASGIATGAEGIKTEEEAVSFGGLAGIAYDPCYHQLCDDVSNVNVTAFDTTTKMLAHSLATYAISLKDFPPRTSSVRTKDVNMKSQMKYRGDRLIM